MGALGEDIAARFLTARGLTIEGRNVRVGRGEIDIVARAPDGERVAVEVKTGRGGVLDPASAFTFDKAAQVATLARRLDPPVFRVDLVAVRLDTAGAAIRWVRRAG